nr:alpha/beta fold hydrolase [Micromonospora sp. DSM 115978]
TAHGGDAADAFHLVVPSLPGYGFSGQPAETGWDVQRTAKAWATLMARLGYDRYLAQGGDWGSAVTMAIGGLDPDHVAGVHVNMAPFGPSTDADLTDLTDDELASLTAAGDYLEWGMGYAAEQGTRPQTVGYGLVDSPVALAAWISEKFWAWTAHDGDPYTALSRDRMLDDITLYWLTATGASSARLYWEVGVGRPSKLAEGFGVQTVTVPSGVSVFLPARDHPTVPALAAEALHRPAVLRPAEGRRPLRRLRAARPVHRPGTQSLPHNA